MSCVQVFTTSADLIPHSINTGRGAARWVKSALWSASMSNRSRFEENRSSINVKDECVCVHKRRDKFSQATLNDAGTTKAAVLAQGPEKRRSHAARPVCFLSAACDFPDAGVARVGVKSAVFADSLFFFFFGKALK